MKTKKELSLRQFISDVGTQELAKALKINEATVRHWRSGLVLPRPRQMLQLMDISLGRITPTAIVQDHFKPTNKKRSCR